MLEKILRPAGGGVYVVSTGLAEQKALQRAIYGAEDDEAIEARWHEALARIEGARAIVLGAPSDAGAGYTRGSNRGPEAIRRALLDRPAHPYHDEDIVDIGDLRVIPHLLSDAMLNHVQIEACREALFGADGDQLPVAPLELCATALERVRDINPSATPVVLGGDHSLGWPSFQSSFEAVAGDGELGVLQIDAHTDLLAERLGVRYCFATWAYHANEALGRDGRLVQIGIRASGHDREHWESTLGVRQMWAEEVRGRDPREVADEIIAHLEERGVTHLHISHDIDGTDSERARATGTPEPDGLQPEFVRELVRGVRARLPLVGADLVEVAPPLTGGDPAEPERTVGCAVDYLEDLLVAD
jgi:agmatinase